MKKMSDLEQTVFNLALPIAKEFGIDLLDVEYKTHDRQKVLSVIIDKKGGVNLENCADISMALDPVLDEKDLIKGEYNLEVTSPGVDRPLSLDTDLERNIGVLIEVALFLHKEKRLKFEGLLDSYDKDSITIKLDEPFIRGVRPKTNGQLRIFLRNEIKTIKKAIRF